MTCAPSLRSSLAGAIAVLFSIALCCPLQARVEQDLSGHGWSLWHDKAAAYLDDELHLPPVDLARLPAPAPTVGWDRLGEVSTIQARVPGTAEEFLQTIPGPVGDITGVTWWSRRIQIPTFDKGARLLLRFEAVRQRAEIFLNRKLVGYDMIGNTPFEVDISSAAKSGESAELAVRITDVGGNFDWRDGAVYPWGRHSVLMSHGFGGITGGIRLVVCDPVRVEDLAVLNTPTPRKIKVLVALRNDTETVATRDLALRVVDTTAASRELTRLERKALVVPAKAQTTLELDIEAPEAILWDLENPQLYHCELALSSGGRVLDFTKKRFGFRWFAPEGIGSDATLRLNGKRIVLRSAISWGFWPVNGITPSPEWAERQIRIAKAYGLNMLNFHRCIGQTILLDKADELGLLIYEEPGNWKGGDRAPLARAMAREKWLRMIKRDRSHPSLIIYNLINEDGAASAQGLEARRSDMQAARAIDPSRVITRTSGWSKSGVTVEDAMKMHFRPYDPNLHQTGWFDYHHAGGPATWNDDLYRSFEDYYNRTTNKEEIVFWGEEGAISTPPRLGMIRDELSRLPNLGWDGAGYLEQYQRFDDFITRKGLRAAFPRVDDLTGALGDVSINHQGRKIQLIRLNNLSDGYAINGWESELIENHSGVVDCFRNPKGNPELLAKYNRPVYVAVMPRAQVAKTETQVTVDYHLVNEGVLKGPYELETEVLDATGAVLERSKTRVNVTGGDCYGEPLVLGKLHHIGHREGLASVRARLLDPSGAQRAEGEDKLLAVDWENAQVTGNGAVFGNADGMREFLKKHKGVELPDYQEGMGKLDWLIVTRSPDEDLLRPIPTAQLRYKNKPGLQASFYSGRHFARLEAERLDVAIDLNINEGAIPDPGFPGTEQYQVRWEGELLPTKDGIHAFGVTAGGGGIRLQIAGKTLIDSLGKRGRESSERVMLELKAGQPVPVLMEFAHHRGAGRCELLWAPPVETPPNLDRLFERVRDDGTKLVILEYADHWMPLIMKYSKLRYSGSFKVGSAWLGGIHFIREHPLAEGLPVNTAMDWPYQALVRNGKERSGLLIEGEEFVAGAWHCNEENSPMQLGTALGVVPCGKGSIIVSTLDISRQLGSEDGPAQVARRMLCNFLKYERPLPAPERR